MNKGVRFWGLTLVFAFLLIASFVLAESSIVTSSGTDAESPDSSPKKVNVSIYVINLGKFDIATGSFTADFYLSMKCEDTCSPENFEFMNGRAASIDKITDTPNEKFYRIQANLNSPVDLRKFPFDSQKMQIILEDRKSVINDLKYAAVKEESGLDDAIAFPGWRIDGWKTEVKEHNYAVYGEAYSQYIFTVDISKIPANSFIKTFLPVIFILLIVLFTMFMDPDKIVNRLTIAGTGLIAAVMFHVSIANQLPPAGYLTFSDKFMILSYLVLVAAFVINISLLELQERGNKKMVEKVHRSTEYSLIIIVPILYLLLFLFLL